MRTRKCATCGTTHPLGDFPRGPASNANHGRICRACKKRTQSKKYKGRDLRYKRRYKLRLKHDAHPTVGHDTRTHAQCPFCLEMYERWGVTTHRPSGRGLCPACASRRKREEQARRDAAKRGEVRTETDRARDAAYEYALLRIRHSSEWKTAREFDALEEVA